MPFKDYHSAKVSKEKFKGYRWKKDAFEKGIDVLYGLTSKAGPKGGRSKVASFRFNSSLWSASQAREWLADHDYEVLEFTKATGKKEESYKPLIATIYELTTTASVPGAARLVHPADDEIGPCGRKKYQGRRFKWKGNRG